MTDKVGKLFYKHFQDFALNFKRYRVMYRYYWSMIAHYHNYFIHEDDSVLEIGCGTGDTL